LKVRGFLKNEAYEKAVKMLCSVLEVWGDLEELQVADEELDTIKMVDVENECEEEDDEKDTEEEEKEQSM